MAANPLAANPRTAPPARPERRRVRIGELLVASGRVSEGDLPRIAAFQERKGLRFGEAAVELGLVSVDDVQRALARQFNYPYLKRGDSNLSPMVVSAYQPFDPCAEVFRVLRSQLTLRWFDRGEKALAIGSARGGCGTSTVAANLAVSFAQLGERTLLIDANLRRPVQHWLFGVLADSGLADVLVGRCSLEEAALEIPPIDRLALLCAGPVPPNPHELLSGKPLMNLLEEAQRTFSVVILDTPAALDFADAQMICARTGAYLLVTRRHQSRVADVRAATLRLAPAGAVMIGAVVSD
ncbi:MAG TPA: polysaccharide biosynthesis tyrosine autokinase [Steroidobacteraceae bacterium]|nr:polysaccharide biosynthesis tyrosine autokinase [Steroidobacteraceae bacterium]